MWRVLKELGLSSCVAIRKLLTREANWRAEPLGLGTTTLERFNKVGQLMPDLGGIANDLGLLQYFRSRFS